MLHLGQARLRGDLRSYSESFDLLEVSAEPSALPRRSRLRAWKRDVPEQFVFTLRLPAIVASLAEESAGSGALAEALRVAEVLGADWLVLSTPAEVTPCARTRQRLRRLADAVPRDRYRIAWEPRGLWEDPQEEQVAQELGWVVVRDLRRRPPPPGPVVYTRLLALGSAARQTEALLARLQERIASATEAFVVVEGGGAARVRDYLRSIEP